MQGTTAGPQGHTLAPTQTELPVQSKFDQHFPSGGRGLHAPVRESGSAQTPFTHSPLWQSTSR